MTAGAPGDPGRESLADRRDASPQRIIETLLEGGVEFVIIGGVAAIAHGVQRTTRDVDVLIEPSEENRRRAISALVGLGAEEFLPATKRWVAVSERADPDWLLREPRFFDSVAGAIDICNAIEGVPEWAVAHPHSIEVEAFGKRFLVLDKDTLIRSKLAAGRDKDRADVTELGQI